MLLGFDTLLFPFENRVGYHGVYRVLAANVSEVDFRYENAVDSMTSREKIERSIGLFNWSR